MTSRIDALLGAMTLEEKIGQLTMLAAGFSVTGPVLAEDASEAVREGRAGSLLNVFGPEATRRMQRLAVEDSRLKIPLLLGFDVVHGHRTVFPIPLGEAAAFDPDLWERTAAAAAFEAAADGVALTFAPMIDVARDPRWGRIAEGPGEDPLVASLYASAKVRGFQGSDLADPDRLAATAKHFVAYGAATAGRDYASVDISDRTLNEVYLPPFAAAIAAGVAAVMPAFNDLAGVPMTANGKLLNGWLRGAQGFNGVVISDYNAIAELIVHGIASTPAEAAALALKAGVDIDMMGDIYPQGLPTALQQGLIVEVEIDACVRRVLALKERLGLFDATYRRGSDTTGASAHAHDHRELAREAARRSIVMLTHDGKTLPVSAEQKRIAVIGPLADAAEDMLGPWSGAGEGRDCVTILDGLRAARPDADIRYAQGAGIERDDETGLAEALDLGRWAEVIVLAIGEARTMSGEAASRAGIDLPGRQRALAETLMSLGKPLVALLSCGRPLALPWLFSNAGAVLATWFLGSEAGHAIADILTGRASPGGRLAVTWPRSVGQVPIFYAERRSGRPAGVTHYTSKYLDIETTPQFAFGHGLTYGKFSYSRLKANPAELRPGSRTVVSVEVTNTGAMAADETVFLFIRAVASAIARPVMELKGFARIALAPGETSEVVLTLSADALAVLDEDWRPQLEPGEFELLVGPSADREGLLSTIVTLTTGSR